MKVMLGFANTCGDSPVSAFCRQLCWSAGDDHAVDVVLVIGNTFVSRMFSQRSWVIVLQKGKINTKQVLCLDQGTPRSSTRSNNLNCGAICFFVCKYLEIANSVLFQSIFCHLAYVFPKYVRVWNNSHTQVCHKHAACQRGRVDSTLSWNVGFSEFVTYPRILSSNLSFEVCSGGSYELDCI